MCHQDTVSYIDTEVIDIGKFGNVFKVGVELICYEIMTKYMHE